MPSQPVASLRRDLHGCRNPRYSGRLGGVGGVSGPGFTHYRPSAVRFSDAGLWSVNFNIRTGRRETGSIMGRDQLRIALARTEPRLRGLIGCRFGSSFPQAILTAALLSGVIRVVNRR